MSKSLKTPAEDSFVKSALNGGWNNNLSPTSLGKRCRTHQTDELRKWPQNTQNSQTKPFTLHTIGVQSY